MFCLSPANSGFSRKAVVAKAFVPTGSAGNPIVINIKEKKMKSIPWSSIFLFIPLPFQEKTRFSVPIIFSGFINL